MKHQYYHYEKDGIKYTVAAGVYAGKKVRAVAKCAPNDQYDEEYGEMLAGFRFDRKCLEIKKALTVKYRAEVAQQAHEYAVREANAELDLKEIEELIYYVDEQIGKLEE